MADEHEGHGGSYTVDKNGKRSLVHRTEDAPAPVRAEDGKKKKPSKTDGVNDA